MGAQKDPLFRAHAPSPAQALHYHRTLENQLLTALIAEGNGPATKFIESIKRLYQMTIESVAAVLLEISRLQRVGSQSTALASTVSTQIDVDVLDFSVQMQCM
jgi:hypothetical protein